ncbi:hypothetical protein P7K49_011175 [Saguinus oedipus]|uniref:Uncharacterized protein n=1 Tax=Saguinus oedipus TaxID=9490 RepID=A0ABQ9VRA1_SAGOE|nr:hypothetical protein P7K49_011175 [Saguinus oedipus]
MLTSPRLLWCPSGILRALVEEAGQAEADGGLELPGRCPVLVPPANCPSGVFGSYSEKRHLQVNVTNPVQCSLHGKKCTVSVETRLNQPQPDFTKNRSGFILSVPGN